MAQRQKKYSFSLIINTRCYIILYDIFSQCAYYFYECINSSKLTNQNRIPFDCQLTNNYTIKAILNHSKMISIKVKER